MRLVGVELTRLRWRRAVLVLLLLAVVIPARIGREKLSLAGEPTGGSGMARSWPRPS